MARNEEDHGPVYRGLGEADKAFLARFERQEEDRKKRERQRQRLAEKQEQSEWLKATALSPTARRYQEYKELRAAAKRRRQPLTETEDDVCLHDAVYDWKPLEIVKALGLSHDSVRTHLSNGKAKLRPERKERSSRQKQQ